MTSPDDFLLKKLKICIEKNHRLFLILPSTSQLSTVFSLHAQEVVGPRPLILWLYKDLDPATKSHFNADATFYPHTETEKILGNTFGALVLQDYESVTPNILARCIETVQGGGLIVLITKDAEFMQQGRFSRRLFKSFMGTENILMYDENFVSLKKNKPSAVLNNPAVAKTSSKVDVVKKTRMSEDDIRKEIYDDTISQIYELSKTDDQQAVLMKLVEILSERSCKTVCSVTAARGRGKSATLGLAISLAIFKSLSTIFISAPNLENVGTIFEFILKGITLLGYKERIHYSVFRKNVHRKRYIYKIVFTKTHRQVIEYVCPYSDMRTFPDLLVIDEAASIPIPHIKKMLGANLVFMTSTVSGYEGTGRSISLKLFTELRRRSNSENLFLFKEFELLEPIRYSINDPIENWLNDLLFLSATPLSIGSCPSPSDCQLFYINKDALFTYHKTSELFLKSLVSLFVASHYKNSPDDLLLMADTHHIFTLLSPIHEGACELPKIICAVQVAFESVENKSQRQGNLIPWTIYDNYLKNEFLEIKGMRIIRIAVHPDYVKMGYGTRAVKLLCDFFLTSPTYTNENDTSLILPLSSLKIDALSYVGASFGATSELVNFWKKNNFVPVHLRQTHSPITGEHSTIMVRSNDPLLIELFKEYQLRFLRLLPSAFKHLPPTLCLTLFYDSGMRPAGTGHKTEFTCAERIRIESFNRGLAEIGAVYDLIAQFAFAFFTGQSDAELNVFEQCLILGIGAQFRSIEEMALALNVERQRISSVLAKIIGRIYNGLRYN